MPRALLSLSNCSAKIELEIYRVQSQHEEKNAVDGARMFQEQINDEQGTPTVLSRNPQGLSAEEHADSRLLPIRREINFDAESTDVAPSSSISPVDLLTPTRCQTPAYIAAKSLLKDYRDDINESDKVDSPDNNVWTFERRLIKERHDLQLNNAALDHTMKLQKASIADYDFRCQRLELQLQEAQVAADRSGAKEAPTSRSKRLLAGTKKLINRKFRTSPKSSKPTALRVPMGKSVSPGRRRTAAAAAAAARRRVCKPDTIAAGAESESKVPMRVRAKILGITAVAPDFTTFFFGKRRKASSKKEENEIAEPAPEEQQTSEEGGASDLSTGVREAAAAAAAAVPAPADLVSSSSSPATVRELVAMPQTSQKKAKGGFGVAVEDGLIISTKDLETVALGSMASVSASARPKSRPKSRPKRSNQEPAWKSAFKAELKRKENQRKLSEVIRKKEVQKADPKVKFVSHKGGKQGSKAQKAIMQDAEERTDVERKVLANVETTDTCTAEEAAFEKEMASFVESSTALPDLPAHEQYQLRLMAKDPHNKLGPEPDLLPAEHEELLPGKAIGEDVRDLTLTAALHDAREGMAAALEEANREAAREREEA